MPDTDGKDLAVMMTQQPMSEGMKAFMGKNERDWSTNICGCCTDCKESCLFLWCPCVFQCFLARRMRENCLVPWCVPAGMIAMRVRMRSKLDIKGNICRDCFATMLCGPLVACQMSRELDHIGIPKFHFSDVG